MDPPVGSWDALGHLWTLKPKDLDLCNMYPGFDFYLALPSAKTTNPHSPNHLHVHAACNLSNSEFIDLPPWSFILQDSSGSTCWILGRSRPSVNPKPYGSRSLQYASSVWFLYSSTSCKTTNPHSPNHLMSMQHIISQTVSSWISPPLTLNPTGFKWIYMMDLGMLLKAICEP